MKQKLIFIGLLMLLSMTPIVGRSQGQPRVIQSCGIPDIGIANFDAWGNGVIYWNPCLAGQYGPQISAFAFQHELGHIYLRTSNESAADCYAVRTLRNINPGAIWAFIEFKRAQGMSGGDRTHLPGVWRAQHVYECLIGRHGH